MNKGPSQLLVSSSSTAHDAQGPSIRVIALTNIVQLEDRRHPCGDEAGDIAAVLDLAVAGLFLSGFSAGGSLLRRLANLHLPCRRV